MSIDFFSRCQECATPNCFDFVTDPSAARNCIQQLLDDGICNTQITSE